MAIERPSGSTLIIVAAIGVLVIPMVVARGCDPGDPFDKIKPPFVHHEERTEDTGARQFRFDFPLPPVHVYSPGTVPPESVNTILESLGLVPVTTSGVNCASSLGHRFGQGVWHDRYQWGEYPEGPLTLCLQTTQWPPYEDRGIVKDYSGVRFLVVGDMGFKQALARERAAQELEQDRKARRMKK